jgi:hypothetical protein
MLMMKKVLFTVMMMAVFGAALFAQPKAVFFKLDHNFGEINEVDGPVSADFTILNNGNEPLVLTEVKPSCGCTQPEWTQDSIMPGDTGFVRATFNPANLPGPFEKVVYVRTNGVPNAMNLFFRGYVVPRPFDITEKYPLEFGKLRVDNNFVMLGEGYTGDIDSGSFKVYNQSNEDVTIKYVTNVHPFINFEIPSLRIKPKEETTIKIKYDTKASGKYGEQNYVFYINTADSPAVIEIPIFAQIHIKEKFPKMSKKQLDKAPKIQVDAQMLYLGKILKGDSASFQYTLTNMGSNKLIIRSVNVLCGCTVSAVDKKELKRGESTLVRVTFHSEGREGVQEKYVTIVSNDPVTPELKIGFRTEVVTNPNALKY